MDEKDCDVHHPVCVCVSTCVLSFFLSTGAPHCGHFHAVAFTQTEGGDFLEGNCCN